MSTLSNNPIAVRTRQWAKENPERYRASQLRFRKKNRKACRKCNKALPYPSPGRLYCKGNCSRQARLVNSRASRDKEQLEFTKYKKKLGCKKCGYNKCGAALDFHHINPDEKERRVTCKTWQTRLGEAEIKKCILICKNCHMEEHNL